MLWQEVIGLFDFRCYLGCRFVEFDASIISHMLVYCFLLISIARYIFKSPRICFWGTKYDVYRERVVYLHCILLWRRARLWLELFASTEDKFFSRVSYLPSHVFLRRRRSFTSRKLYACLEKFNRDSTLDVQTHYKQTETFQYTNFYSCHPPGVKKGFIKGEALRLLRTNSSHSTFNKNMQSFKKRLKNRGYPN